MARRETSEPKWIEMPSLPADSNQALEPNQDYHDLAERYPQAPVTRAMGDAIVHRAVLDDITGIHQLMNWVSDGDIVIVEMSGLVNREIELQSAITRLQNFIEGDMCGTVFGLGHNRLLLLPPSFDTKKIIE